MVERIPIFNAKGIQLGYIECNAAFDFNGTQRCSYTEATGNLCDLKSGNSVSHVSLDGTFVGATWVAGELFGKPSDNAAKSAPPKNAGSSRSDDGDRGTAGKCGEANYGVAIGCYTGPAIYPDDQERLSTSEQPVSDVRATPCLKSDPGALGSVIPPLTKMS